jgi:ribosomal protein L21E
VEFIHRQDKKHNGILIVNKIIKNIDDNLPNEALIRRNLSEDEQAFKEAFDRIHGGNSNLHFGVKRTYQAFSRYYPGHKIPYRVFVEMVAVCPMCQQYKVRSFEGFRAICKVIQPMNLRESIAIDRLSISPMSERGNSTLIVIVTMYSKLIYAEPTSEYTAVSIARALLKFYSLYGKFDILRSDKGSDIISDAVDQLLKWIGHVEKITAITFKAQSSGAEKSNHKILQHLGALTAHHKAKLIWDSPEYLSLVLFKLNSSYNEETNSTAFDCTFGTFENDKKNHFNFVMKLGDKPNKYVQQVHEHMRLINSITKEYQENLNKAKTEINPPNHLVNKFAKGDYVTLRNRKLFKKYKLDSEYEGVYEVVKDQISNDVEIKHVNTGLIRTVFVEDIKIFDASPLNTKPLLEQAKEAAEFSSDQILIKKILKVKGDSLKRNSLQFLVLFSDDTEVWKNYDSDLSSTIQYENFIKSLLPNTPYYEPLLFTIKDWKSKMKELNQRHITHLPAKTKLYTFLISYGYDWYMNLGLPDIEPKNYMIELISKGNVKDNPKKIILYCHLFKQDIIADSEYLRLYSITSFNNAKHVIVDNNFARSYPKIMKA